MSKSRLGRRAFLLGTGGVVLTLPFLDAFNNVAKAAPPNPKRFILFYHSQGTILRHQVIPGSSEGNFQLGQIMSPLEPWKDRCLFLSGVDNKISGLNRSNGHNSSTRSCLTANVYSSALDANNQLIPTDAQPDVEGHASGPSIDQVLAQRLLGGQPYASVDLSISQDNGRLLYAGKDDPVTSEPDPQKAFDRFFAETPASAEELARIRLRKLSVLDAVQENFGRLRQRVGRDDKARLDAHAEKIRAIETSIENAKVCQTPTMDLPTDFNYQLDEAVAAPVQMDLLTMAMSCDLAPVGTLVFGNGHDPGFSGLTVDGQPLSAGYDNWHAMVHEGRNLDAGNGNTYDSPGLVRGYQWYTEQFAGLLERLASTPDTGTDTLLDTTCVLWMSEFGDGVGHNNNKLHIVMAGNTSFPMGRCLTLGEGGPYDPSPHCTNQVFVSVLRAFGFDDTTFGWQQANGVSPGPIPGLG
jgi:Protein of unknown function (DUF1552)